MGKLLEGKWKQDKVEKGKDIDGKMGKDRIYQLKISIIGSNPEIWRRVLVAGNTSLGKLHRIIQYALDWTDSHLHEFIVKDVFYADPNSEMEMHASKSENRARLHDVAPTVRSSFIYIYDFGDGWEHKIKIEKILDHDKRFSGYPVCLEGARACPPEDCGGIYGYYNLLDIINDPEHPEHADMIDWLGEEFDPNIFDLDGTNEVLKKIK